MATGWEMLPEAAKALSAPLTKLVEVCAAGCGRVYGPRDIRRRAEAEGAALVIMEEAKARANEVAVRAARRLLDVEQRRQENLEAIVYVAEQNLPDEVSAQPVDEDWTARFFREAQDVGNEDMQRLWGKLLAGEIARPGSFSRRTLDVVANLTKEEAALFETLCSFIAKVHPQGLYTFIGHIGEPHVERAGLTLDAFTALSAAGLVSRFDSRNEVALMYKPVAQPGSVEVCVERPGDLLLRARPVNPLSVTPLPLGAVSLTPAATELFSVAEWRPNLEHDKVVMDRIGATGQWVVERHRIVDRLEGMLHYVPWERGEADTQSQL
jgi:hypothetical protein